MLGLGEKETELLQTMDDLREVGCEVLTMGQYLAPEFETLARHRIHHAGAVRLLRRHRAEKRFSVCRLRAAGPQLLSRGRFSPGCAELTDKRPPRVRFCLLSFRAKSRNL